MLPDAGTVCVPDEGPFDKVEELDMDGEDAQWVLRLSAEDRTLLAAVRELSKTWDVTFPAGF